MPRRPRNPDDVRRYNQKAYAKHREKILAQKREYTAAHREEKKAYNAAYRAAHTEEHLAYERARYARNPHPTIERLRAFRATHAEQRRAIERASKAAHPETTLENDRRRRARKAAAPLNDLTAAQWQAIKDHYGHRCVYCGRRMQRLTMDHIQPLSKGGSHTYSNIVPACKSCNSSKHNGPPPVPVQPLLLLPC